MKHVQSAISLFTAIALAVIAAACSQEGENRSALTAATGPSAIVQNHEGDVGCTPGFWKKKPWPASVNPSATLGATFTGVPANLAGVTLLDALSLGGGGVYALMRHGVAALLNAASIQYPVNTFFVTLAVNNALGGLADIEATKDQFDVWNNVGAPGFCD
jgi:hypothetical protein